MKTENQGDFWCFLKNYIKKKWAFDVVYIFLLKQSNEEGIEDHETNNQFYRVTKMISSVAALYFSGLRKELKLSVKLIT